jgi:acetolactate decarboxylase
MIKKFNYKHFLILACSILLVGLLQHDFVDQAYHSIVNSKSNFQNLKIKVNDTDFSKGRLGNMQEIYLQDLIKFHGHACDGLVEGFLALQRGLYELFPDHIIDRTNIRIISKPSPCLTDAAVYLTGGRFQFNTFYVSDEIDGLYIIQRIDTGKTVKVSRKSNIKPAVIDTMGAKAIAFELSPCELDILKAKEEEYAAFLLNANPKDVFEIQEIKNYSWKPELRNDFQKADILNKNQPKCN